MSTTFLWYANSQIRKLEKELWRMRLDRKKFQKIVDREKWAEEIICHRTGLTRRTVEWIMKNGEVSEDALERIADMAGG